MADMKDALRKAGLVDQKAIRQTQHAERVRRTELGEEGLAADRVRREAELLAEQQLRRDEDRERERGLQAQRVDASHHARIEALLREGNLMAREGGPRRFFFEHPDGLIHFLDASPGLVRRLQMGDAAIVDVGGILPGDFIAVPGKIAHELRLFARERILFWTAGER